MSIIHLVKTVNRKVQGVSQSQVAANACYQEEETKINVCKINKQINEKDPDQLSPPKAR